MTQEEIMEMAREAGLLPDNAHPAPETRAMRQRSEAAQIFATLVAEKASAKEREACAQLCESAVWTASIPEWRDMTKHDIAVKSMLACAAAIRARGTKEGV